MAGHTPGPWRVGPYASDIWAPSAKGGETRICDIRGWGYLTGKGHGALGLSEAEAIAVQTANADMIAAAPDMLAALKTIGLVLSARMRYMAKDDELFGAFSHVIAAVAKADGAK